MCRWKSHEGERAPSCSKPGGVKLGPFASPQDGSTSTFEEHPHHQALTITSLLSMFMAASFMSPSAPASLLLLRGSEEVAAGEGGAVGEERNAHPIERQLRQREFRYEGECLLLCASFPLRLARSGLPAAQHTRGMHGEGGTCNVWGL